MKLITSSEILSEFLPPRVPPVAGEADTFNILEPFIAAAEEWVAHEIAPLELIESNAEARSAALSVVACRALAAGLPVTDVVITPNGIGVVNTETIAPASKERVERLINTLEEAADEATDSLIRAVALMSPWRATPQHDAVTMSLTYTFTSDVEPGHNRWERLKAAREKAVSVEHSIAMRFISTEVIDALRLARPGGLSVRQNIVAGYIRRYVSAVCGDCREEAMQALKAIDDAVEFIRTHADDFPEWANSDAAKLYASKPFQNNKNAGGFFF